MSIHAHIVIFVSLPAELVMVADEAEDKEKVKEKWSLARQALQIHVALTHSAPNPSQAPAQSMVAMVEGVATATAAF